MSTAAFAWSGVEGLESCCNSREIVVSQLEWSVVGDASVDVHGLYGAADSWRKGWWKLRRGRAQRLPPRDLIVGDIAGKNSRSERDGYGACCFSCFLE